MTAMMRRVFAAGLLALGLAAQPLGQPAAAQDKVLFQLDWIPTGEHAAYFAGAAKGFFKEQGIDITLTRGYGSGDTINKVAAGAAPFGVADLGGVLAARARQDVPVKSISAIYTHSPHSLFVLKSSGITTFKARRSRSPRATATGSTSPRWRGGPGPTRTRSSG
jgi:NitT/TauT family transport system substrate-binding protein